MKIFKGRLLRLGTVDKCGRMWSKDCKITFPKKVQVAYDFNIDPEFPYGVADITQDDDGLNCNVTPIDPVSLPGDEYFVGGYYDKVKTHFEDSIEIIDSCHLVGMSVIPENSVADEQLKIKSEEIEDEMP